MHNLPDGSARPPAAPVRTRVSTTVRAAPVAAESRFRPGRTRKADFEPGAAPRTRMVSTRPGWRAQATADRRLPDRQTRASTSRQYERGETEEHAGNFERGSDPVTAVQMQAGCDGGVSRPTAGWNTPRRLEPRHTAPGRIRARGFGVGQRNPGVVSDIPAENSGVAQVNGHERQNGC